MPEPTQEGGVIVVIPLPCPVLLLEGERYPGDLVTSIPKQTFY